MHVDREFTKCCHTMLMRFFGLYFGTFVIYFTPNEKFHFLSVFSSAMPLFFLRFYSAAVELNLNTFVLKLHIFYTQLNIYVNLYLHCVAVLCNVICNFLCHFIWNFFTSEGKDFLCSPLAVLSIFFPPENCKTRSKLNMS